MTRSTGTVVKRPKNMVNLKPPPNCHESHVGIPRRPVARVAFENCSYPAPSAGRGAFLIAGDWSLLVTI
jgi:hypothetical protein